MAATDKTVAVVGLGYVGLPLAVLARSKGWRVYGIDNDAAKVETINHRRTPFKDKRLERQLNSFPVAAGTDPSVASRAAVIVIAVPTPVTNHHQPDLKPLKSAIDSLIPHLRGGQTLVVESTINPGVMDEVVAPAVGQRAGLKLHLVHCPERINPGDPHWGVNNIPRVLGAYTRTGARRAMRFYGDVIDAPVQIMSSPMEAEAVKILENTFRDVNIAFINEMAKSFTALGIDITKVIEGAATKPFAFLPHFPGNGVGGHCISVDPYYMIERARQAGFDHKFLKLARRINESMPAYTVALLKEGLRLQGRRLRGARVALLGLAYKKNVSDIRKSPALDILRILKRRGAAVRVFDPFVPSHSTETCLEDALSVSEAVMLACDHDILVKSLKTRVLKQSNIRVLVDGKNALAGKPMAARGVYYYGVGRSFLPPKEQKLPLRKKHSLPRK